MKHKIINTFIAGHNGMVGSAIYRALKDNDTHKLITASRNQVDLRNQNEVDTFFKENNIDQVYLAAANVGGIHANNTYPAEFIYNNIMIQTNVINAAKNSKVKKLLFLGSSCIYPREALQPIKEESLLTGKLEKTNEAYAIAKISGIKLCESYNKQYHKDGIDYRSVMPTNLYGPGDNYDLENSHVIPALIRKFHEAKIRSQSFVEIWGTGLPMREFLHVDDMANACIHIMNIRKKDFYSLVQGHLGHINVGCGEDISIKDLALVIKKIINFNGELVFNSDKPDGTMRKLLDISLIKKTGWSPKIDLESGIKDTYREFLKTMMDRDAI